MSGRLANKVVVITGAAKGIGRGCAEMVAREGGRVVVADVLEEAGRAAVEGIKGAGGKATFVHTNVLEEDSCAALMETTVHTYGRIDALVNNVGGFPRGTLEETTTEFWESVLSLNLRSAFYCCKHATPHLRAAGGGSIVNIGSIHGVQGAADLVAYSAAKGGLLTMTRTLAGALARDRIRVNYIIPGWVLTDTEIGLQAATMGRSLEDLHRIGAAMPLGRHQTPEDTAYAVVYLTSDESTQVTAALLNVDAGDSMLPNTY
jgi:NAD(P)-dependent dehydrogenase (short-subunit alcohol dehydrogenase family)